MKSVVNILFIGLYALPTLTTDNSQQQEIFTFASPRICIKNKEGMYYCCLLKSNHNRVLLMREKGNTFDYSDSRDRKTWYDAVDKVPLIPDSPTHQTVSAPSSTDTSASNSPTETPSSVSPRSPLRLAPSERQLALEELSKRQRAEEAERKKIFEDLQRQNSQRISSGAAQKIVASSSSLLTSATSSATASSVITGNTQSIVSSSQGNQSVTQKVSQELDHQ